MTTLIKWDKDDPTMVAPGGDVKLPNAIPTDPLAAVPLSYVDSIATGQPAREAAIVATAAALAACTYNNGSSGVGATLTADANGALTIDTYAVQVADRVLIKDQASGLQNGIYVVTATGDGSNPFVLTRSTDFDAASDSEIVNGAIVPIVNGDANENTIQMLVTTGAITVGVTTLTFTQLKANTGTVAATAGGTGQTTYTTGDTLYASAANTLSKLGIGTEGQALLVSAGGVPEWADVEGASGFADYIYSEIPFVATGAANSAWSNMPLAATELFGTSVNRKKVNLTGAVQFRICASQAVAGTSTAQLYLEYSTNNSTFQAVESGTGGYLAIGTGTGQKIGSWTDLVAGAKGDVWIRLMGTGGDSAVDPAFRQLYIEVKYNSTVVAGGDGGTIYNDVAVHAHGSSAVVWTNMPSATTEFLGNTRTRFRYDATNATQYRITVNQAVAGATNADLNLQYSTNGGGSWNAADTAGAGELAVGAGTGLKVGSWADLVEGALGDYQWRLVGKDGDGAVDPSWYEVHVQFKQSAGTTQGSGTADRISYWSDANTLGAVSDFYVDAATGQISFGIPIAAGFGRMMVAGEDALDASVYQLSVSNTESAYHTFMRSRGTIGAFSAVQVTDHLGSILWFGYGATEFGSPPMSLTGVATENFTDSAHGASLLLRIAPIGSTSQANVMSWSTVEVSSEVPLSIKETTTPSSPTANYGYVYPKADNKLYFTDGDGVEHEIAFV